MEQFLRHAWYLHSLPSVLLVWVVISLSGYQFCMKVFHTVLYFYKNVQVGFVFILILNFFVWHFLLSPTPISPLKLYSQALNSKEPHMCLVRDISNCWAPKVETAVTKVSELHTRSWGEKDLGELNYCVILRLDSLF